jgi:ABC-type nickel/cobalt efflux system permease component RcnA
MRTTRLCRHRSATRWIGIRLALVLCSFLLAAGSAVAHPMGNFSINHYAKIRVGKAWVEVLYLVDMAEIPTYQEMRQFGTTANPNDSADLHYLEVQDTRLKQGLTVEIDGQTVTLATISRHVAFADGAGGLSTMKLSLVLRGTFDVPSGGHKLSYSDNNFPGRAGWKEIVVVGGGSTGDGLTGDRSIGDGSTILATTAPEVDRSQELTNYSTDLLNSPPQQLTALVSFSTPTPEAALVKLGKSASISAKPSIDRANAIRAATGGKNQAAPAGSPAMPSPSPKSSTNALSAGSTASLPAIPPPAKSQNTPRSRFTDLISSQNKLGFWVLLSAALIAAGLGALHALEPGHGKTIVAAYLVGSRGTARHAVLLGFVVTAAHTAGVYLLGVVTLYASRYIVPEQLYPWLGAISGLSVAGLGVFIFLKHWTGQSGEHSHAPGEKHSHWFLSLFKAPVTESALPPSAEQTTRTTSFGKQKTDGVSLRELCVLGVTGGIVPCPAALVVLLSAFSLHRVGFGLFLITAFSLGLALVLVIIGLTMVYTKRFMASRIEGQGSIARYLPLLSSSFMVVLGVGIATSAFASAPIALQLVSRDKMVPFVTVILLGLFLGMRHSTDPDHVVAVSTIVSRERSIKSSASIGLLWGLGHTLTIFLVGSAIIIFGVVIPPRLGLSMEFCVALMLIFLGVLNLTGVTKWIAEKSPPAAGVTASEIPPASSLSERGEAKLNVAKRIDAMIGKTVGRLGLYQTIRPLVIGLVHGLAGSAAVALLVLSTIRSPFWATAYLLVFGFGTMLGMMLMTTAISLPLVYTGNRFFKMNSHLATISGLASMAFGMFLVYHIGLVDGLFSARPHWIPQ